MNRLSCLAAVLMLPALALGGCLPSRAIGAIEAVDRIAEGETDKTLGFVEQRLCRLPVDVMGRAAIASADDARACARLARAASTSQSMLGRRNDRAAQERWSLGLTQGARRDLGGRVRRLGDRWARPAARRVVPTGGGKTLRVGAQRRRGVAGAEP